MIYKSILTHYPLFLFFCFVLFYTHIYLLPVDVYSNFLFGFIRWKNKEILSVFIFGFWIFAQTNFKWKIRHTMTHLVFLCFCNSWLQQQLFDKIFYVHKLIIICHTFNLHVKQFWLQKWIWRWCGDIIIILMTARKHCT